MVEDQVGNAEHITNLIPSEGDRVRAIENGMLKPILQKLILTPQGQFRLPLAIEHIVTGAKHFPAAVIQPSRHIQTIYLQRDAVVLEFAALIMFSVSRCIGSLT